MLGPNFYGVPFALRSDGEVISTYKSLHNWITYPLPKAKILQHHHGTQSKRTCYKPLALFMVSASLQSIQVLL
jgi:hypothetical protein